MATITSQTRSTGPATRPGTAALIAAGAVAGPLYVGVALAQALTRQGFDLTRHPWSVLANGELGWIQVTNLIVTGCWSSPSRSACGASWPRVEPAAGRLG